MSRTATILAAAVTGAALGFFLFRGDAAPAPAPRAAAALPTALFTLGQAPALSPGPSGPYGDDEHAPPPPDDERLPTDECEAMRKLWSPKRNPALIPALVRDALPIDEGSDASGLDAATRSSLLDGALAKKSRDELDAYSSSDDPALRFRRALLLSGQWSHLGEGIEAGPPELPGAISALRELEAERPDNGAYAYFLAEALAREPRAEVDAALRRALAAPEFDTMVLPFSQSIWIRGLASPTRLVLASSLLAAFPIPNYRDANRLLLDRLHGDDSAAWADDAIAFGERLMDAQNAGAEAGGREFVHWFAIEHAIGWKLVHEAWPRAGRTDPIPPQYAERYGHYFDFNRIERWGAEIGAFVKGAGPCPRSDLEAELDHWRAYRGPFGL